MRVLYQLAKAHLYLNMEIMANRTVKGKMMIYRFVHSDLKKMYYIQSAKIESIRFIKNTFYKLKKYLYQKLRQEQNSCFM